jgi:hypothetical protein
MLRVFVMIVGTISTAILFAEAVGIAWLWQQGNLTAQTLFEIRHLVTGPATDEEDSQTEQLVQSDASQQDVQNERLLRVLDLESRGKELELLKTMTENSAIELISARQTFDEMKQAFRKELQQREEQQQSAAIEQARAILLASPVESAVERLLALPPEEAIELLRGMPEKSIAKILQGFEAPAPDGDDRKARGQQFFEALSRGEPIRGLIQDALEQNSEGAADSPPGDG